MNLLQNKMRCIQCNSKKLIKDLEKQEVYCANCGLILLNNDIPTLEHLIYLAEIKNDDKENKKQSKKDYYDMKKELYYFILKK